MWRSTLTALAVLTLATSGSARGIIACPTPEPNQKTPEPIYTVEQFELDWCWPDLPGAPLYRVETRTNNARWVEEAVVDTNHVTLLRDLGDAVELRVRACWESKCSRYSNTSRKAWVLPNFDANGSGWIDSGDFMRLRVRGGLAGVRQRQFFRVYLREIVGRRYE